MQRRSVFTTLVGLAAAGAWPALAQPANDKVLTLVVPYPPGGGSDILARAIQPSLQTVLGQTVVVENVAGASGSLAARKVMSAPPDGNTLLIASPSEVVLAPMSIPSVGYTAEDFRMINLFYVNPLALYARTSLPASNIDSLIEMARDPARAELSYASTGVGSIFHVVGEKLRSTTGARMFHVPYKGGAPLIQDLMGGQIDLTFLPLDRNLLGIVETGKMKLLGVAAPARSTMAPNAPIFDESKLLKGFHHSVWFGTLAPIATPEANLRRLHQALAQVVQMPEVRKATEARGAELGPPLPLADAARFYSTENARIRQLTKGVKLES